MISNRTLEDYKRAGAYMRLLKTIFAKTYIEVSKVTRVHEYENKLNAAEKRIDSVCSKAEDNMFYAYPKLSDEYLDIFYGDASAKPRNDVDREQLDLMQELVKEVFGENWK